MSARLREKSVPPLGIMSRVGRGVISRIALIVVAALAIVGGFAPLLAGDEPYSLSSRDGRMWPLFAALDRSDIVGIFFSLGCVSAWGVCLVLRRSSRRGRTSKSVVPWLVFGIVIAAGASIAASHDVRFGTRRWYVESEVRTTLSRLDARLFESGDLAADTPRSAVVEYGEFHDSLPLVAGLSLEVEERMELLETASLEERRRGLARLRDVNDREASALEAATFPPIPHAYDRPSGDIRQPPGDGHILGTDAAGRDLAARLIHGTRHSLGIAIAVTLLACSLGLILGALAGYYRGTVDWWISRLIETAMCLPALFLLIVLAAYVPPDADVRVFALIVFLAAVSFTLPARLVRTEVTRVRQLDFVRAARALGAGDARILFRHVLPHALTPLLVAASVMLGGVILVEAALAFLGFGIPGAPSWGAALREARNVGDLGATWHLALFPGFLIFAAVFAFNWLGDALRDAADPRAR